MRTNSGNIAQPPTLRDVYKRQSPTRVFGKVILPLSMPGVMSGIVMVFMPTVSTFAIAELLTMNNIKLFGTTVQENIYNGMWNYGAARCV